MSDEHIDWSLTTFEGLRRKQQRELHALSFREKLDRLEQMAEVAALFARRPQPVEPRPAPPTSPPPSSGQNSG